MECSTINASLEKKKDPRFTTRVNITVHSYRYRLADPDGISAKAVIDQIVRSGILSDDSAKEIEEVRFKQTKIKKTCKEKTIIRIEEV